MITGIDRAAYKAMGKASVRFELELFREAARLAESQGDEILRPEHVELALREAVGQNPSLLRVLTGNVDVQRQAG